MTYGDEQPRGLQYSEPNRPEPEGQDLRPVEAIIQENGHLIETLNSRWMSIEGRIDPILRAEDTKTDSVEQPPMSDVVGGSHIVRSLQANNTGMIALIRSMERVLNRLEV